MDLRIAIGPEGQALVSLEVMVNSVIPVFIEIGGRRLRVTGWDNGRALFICQPIEDQDAY